MRRCEGKEVALDETRQVFIVLPHILFFMILGSQH